MDTQPSGTPNNRHMKTTIKRTILGKTLAITLGVVAMTAAASAQQPWVTRQTWIPQPVQQFFVPYTSQPVFRNVQYQAQSNVMPYRPSSFGSAVGNYFNWSYGAGRSVIQAGDAWYQMQHHRQQTGRWIPPYVR